jgi:hypothetical protein
MMHEVARAEDRLSSSSGAYVLGRADGLTDLAARSGVCRNWCALLRQSQEAGDLPREQAAAIELHIRTGWPLGDTAFIARLEQVTGRTLARPKPGPKPK